jgi:uncharacterized OB-fold protein
MTTTPYLKPLPQVTEQNRPFWDGLQRHEFLVPKCRDCGDYNWAPYPACRSCLSENQEWTKVSGDGEIYTYTIIERGHGQFNDEAPYAFIVVKLAESPRDLLVIGNTRGIPNEDIKIGLPVKIVFEDIPDEDITMWRFGPA